MSVLFKEKPFAVALGDNAWARTCAFCLTTTKSIQDTFMEGPGLCQSNSKLRRCMRCKQDDNWWKADWDIFSELYRKCSKFFREVDEKRFSEILAAVRRFYFPILRYDIQKAETLLGFGIYLETSRFPHTCVQPDLTFYTEGHLLTTKLISSDMSSNDPSNKTECSLKPENLTICLLSSGERPPSLSSISERASSLRRHLMECGCSLCQDDVTDSLRLYGIRSRCASCGGILTLAPEERESLACCSQCRSLVGIPEGISERIRNLFLSTEAYEKAIRAGESDPSLDEPLRLWDAAEKFMDSDHNILLLQLRERSFAYLVEQVGEEPTLLTPAALLLERILQTLSNAQEVTSYRAVYLVAAAKVAGLRGKIFEGVKLYEEAKAVWSEITHTSHHCVLEIQEAIHKLLSQQQEEHAENIGIDTADIITMSQEADAEQQKEEMENTVD